MTKKTKKSAAKQSSGDNVVRIRASSAPVSKDVEATEPAVTTVVAAKTEKAVKAKKVKTPRQPGTRRAAPKALSASGGYFIGAWKELRQVRWPNRRATWSLTGAVLAYSAFFVLLVLLLDAGFKYLFQLILGK